MARGRRSIAGGARSCGSLPRSSRLSPLGRLLGSLTAFPKASGIVGGKLNAGGAAIFASGPATFTLIFAIVVSDIGDRYEFVRPLMPSWFQSEGTAAPEHKSGEGEGETASEIRGGSSGEAEEEISFRRNLVRVEAGRLRTIGGGEMLNGKGSERSRGDVSPRKPQTRRSNSSKVGMAETAKRGQGKSWQRCEPSSSDLRSTVEAISRPSLTSQIWHCLACLSGSQWRWIATGLLLLTGALLRLDPAWISKATKGLVN